MGLLSREAILQAQDLATEDVSVPEWGGDVRVRALTGTERDAFGAALLGPDGKSDLTNYRARLVAACLVDETGARLFADAEMLLLGGKSAAALERVFAVADRLNAIGSQAVGDAEKNS